jgi:hypothetical protein
MTSYAINGTREQHRAYFDESGRLIYHGPGWWRNVLIRNLVGYPPQSLKEKVRGYITGEPG